MHILLITRHYPPEISGGARRPSLYATAWRKLGHKVTVVTPFDNGNPGNIVVSSPAIRRGATALRSYQGGDPAKSQAMKAFIRQWLYWPDENINWAKDVLNNLRRIELDVDWIFTTSPPESVHIVGAKLSKELRVPWIAEFRDTWIVHPHRKILEKSAFRARIESRMATNILKSANAITAVSEFVIDEARSFVRKGTPECIIPHFSDRPICSHDFDGDYINFVHTGGFTLSDRRRKIKPLLKKFEDAAKIRPEIKLHIAGPLTSDEINSVVNTIANVEWHGSVSLNISRAMQLGADGLILYTPENSHALPGKYAEYIMAEKPILYMGGGDWLQLVDNPSSLQPITPGLLNVKKNETFKLAVHPTNMDAAQTLINFLYSVTNS